jgi:glutamate-5-semialdehyde dehydrogenase
MLTLEDIGARAANAKRVLACAGSQKKDEALKNIARALIDRQQEILNANGADVRNGEQAGLTPALLDRLRLDDKRMRDMADSVLKVADMEDPVGKILSGSSRPNGLKIRKITVPLGFIAIIYEARPNVSSDAATLCLKAGNAVILRGGKEALQSNKPITACMRRAVEDAGLPADCIQLVEDTSRESAAALMRLNAYVDVLIPRGGAGLINAVVQNSTVPVIETGVGNCHIYVDTAADIDMAANIVYNAKTSRPSVCNACESLLIHKDIAEMALLAIAARLNEKQVEVRGDEAVWRDTSRSGARSRRGLGRRVPGLYPFGKSCRGRTGSH